MFNKTNVDGVYYIRERISRLLFTTILKANDNFFKKKKNKGNTSISETRVIFILIRVTVFTICLKYSLLQASRKK